MISKDSKPYNGWTNKATYQVACTYFSDECYMLECIDIDLEDAVFAFERHLLAPVPMKMPWTLRKELASALESYMDAFLERTAMDFEDEGDIPNAEKLYALIDTANTWEIALHHCSNETVTQRIMETIEHLSDVLKPGMEAKLTTHID